MKNLKRFLTVLVAVALILSAFTGCITKIDTVAKVNGQDITEEDYIFRYFLGSTIFQSLSAAGYERGTERANDYLEETEVEEGKTLIELCKEEALDSTVRLYAELEKAKKDSITLTEEDRDAIKAEDKYYEQMVGGEEEYNKTIAQLGITRDEYDKMSENFKISDKLQEKYLSVTDEEVKKAIKDEEYICAKHILFVTIDPATNIPLSDEEIAYKKEMAVAAMDQLKSGADFDALMNEFSEDPGLAQSPDGYTFKKGEMVEPFEKAAYALEENKISDIVESSFGYHIIKRVPIGEDFVADKKSSIMTEKYREIVGKWVEEFGFEKFEKALKGVEY